MVDGWILDFGFPRASGVFSSTRGLVLPLVTPPSSSAQRGMDSSDDDLEITSVVRRDLGDVDEYIDSTYKMSWKVLLFSQR